MPSEWLPDAFSPDNVRVSFLVEPRLDRLFRGIDEAQAFRSIRLLPGPTIGEALRRLLPGERQQAMTNSAWRLVIEADSGQKVSLLRPTRQAAIETAEQVAEQVKTDGLAVLSTLSQ